MHSWLVAPLDLRGASQNWVSVGSPVLGIRHASSPVARVSGLSGCCTVGAVPAPVGELEHVSRPRAALPLTGRALGIEAAVAGAVAVAAVLLAAVGEGRVRWDVAVVLVVSMAVAVRAQFDVGSGYTPPTQLIFVPALLLEPPRAAPLIALAGWMLGRIPDVVRGELHVSRLLLKVPANCWFAIGPAIVFEAAGVRGPSWDDWPIRIAALAAQFLGDLLSGGIREWIEAGVPPALQLRALLYVWLFDAVLSPVGLLAAFASVDHKYAFVGVLPLAGLLAVFSTERRRRFEAELAGVRAREAMIAGASHELRTPLSVLSGLIETLERSPDADGARRAEVFAAMRRQTGQLRHLVGQFIDYAELKAGRSRAAQPRSVAVADALAAVAELWEGEILVSAPPGARALADPGALDAVLMTLVSNALKHGPPEAPVTLTAHTDRTLVVIEVADQGPGLAPHRIDEVFAGAAGGVEGPGFGLYLARERMRAMG